MIVIMITRIMVTITKDDDEVWRGATDFTVFIDGLLFWRKSLDVNCCVNFTVSIEDVESSSMNGSVWSSGAVTFSTVIYWQYLYEKIISWFLPNAIIFTEHKNDKETVQELLYHFPDGTIFTQSDIGSKTCFKLFLGTGLPSAQFV